MEQYIKLDFKDSKILSEVLDLLIKCNYNFYIYNNRIIFLEQLHYDFLKQYYATEHIFLKDKNDEQINRHNKLYKLIREFTE